MDLIPTEDPATLGKVGDFCSAGENGELAVNVTNRGGEDILVSTVTAVIFEVGYPVGEMSHSMVTQELPAIAAGQTIVQNFAIPASCYNPNCDFEIILDYYDVLDESSKANNSVDGVCLGNSELEGDEGDFGTEEPEAPEPGDSGTLPSL